MPGKTSPPRGCSGNPVRSWRWKGLSKFPDELRPWPPLRFSCVGIVCVCFHPGHTFLFPQSEMTSGQQFRLYQNLQTPRTTKNKPSMEIRGSLLFFLLECSQSRYFALRNLHRDQRARCRAAVLSYLVATTAHFQPPQRGSLIFSSHRPARPIPSNTYTSG